ncbi:class I SAM-dependent methyltransferase [Chitinibacter sp. S2-10]|uniref:class I SAM-dependent methyltransferase n=1 Tax=Chitinibacter sp. S2-10 TaxID=3373597 RepID=UPI003977E0CC
MMAFVLLQIINFPSWLCLLLAVSVSATLARFFHAESWWLGIHLVFLPLIVFAQQLALPSYIYLAAFLVSWMIFGAIAKSRVPLFLTERETLLMLREKLPFQAKVLDIGAGTGTVLRYLQQERPDLQLSGIELAWFPWLWGRMTLARQINWLRGDYHSLNFAAYDYIYAYLSPAAMSELWHKASQEMRPGTYLISNSFDITEREPDEILPLHDWKNGTLLIWRI